MPPQTFFIESNSRLHRYKRSYRQPRTEKTAWKVPKNYSQHNLTTLHSPQLIGESVLVFSGEMRDPTGSDMLVHAGAGTAFDFLLQQALTVVPSIQEDMVGK